MWTHCTDHDVRSEKRETSIFCTKYDVASEPEEGTGLAMSWTSRWEQALAQCLGYEWVNVAQNSTVWRSKLEEMIIGKKQKMVDRKSVPIE